MTKTYDAYYMWGISWKSERLGNVYKNSEYSSIKQRLRGKSHWDFSLYKFLIFKYGNTSGNIKIKTQIKYRQSGAFCTSEKSAGRPSITDVLDFLIIEFFILSWVYWNFDGRIFILLLFSERYVFLTNFFISVCLEIFIKITCSVGQFYVYCSTLYCCSYYKQMLLSQKLDTCHHISAGLFPP